MNAPSDPARRRELAKIHIAAQQLGLDDGAYRAMLWTVARVSSAKDLDHGGRAAVLEHLKGLGFKQRGSRPWRNNRDAGTPGPDVHVRACAGASLQSRREFPAYPARPHSTDTRPQIQKIEALLAEAKRPWAYAVGMARKMYARERLEFCAPDELAGIIAALMVDAKRHGRRTA